METLDIKLEIAGKEKECKVDFDRQGNKLFVMGAMAKIGTAYTPIDLDTMQKYKAMKQAKSILGIE
jgi:hypothetical protein